MAKFCEKCGIQLGPTTRGNYCNHHRDRTGLNNPFYGKRHKKETVENMKLMCRTTSKKLWTNEEYRNKVIKGVSKPRREGFKKEQSLRVLLWYKNNPVQKKLRSIAMSRSWKNGSLNPSNASGSTSKLEIKFFNAVKEVVPFIEKKSLNFKSRCVVPDILVSDSKIIVEFYGDYWHANPSKFKAEDIVHHGIAAQEIWNKDQKRIDLLEEEGYCVEIVWQSDYKEDPSGILQRLSNIINWESCSF